MTLSRIEILKNNMIKEGCKDMLNNEKKTL